MLCESNKAFGKHQTYNRIDIDDVSNATNPQINALNDVNPKIHWLDFAFFFRFVIEVFKRL